jgi:hypothetical protein
MGAGAPGGAQFHVSGQFDPAMVKSLPPQVQHTVFNAIAHAVQGVFTWVTPAAVLLFVLALFIKEVPLRGRAPAAVLLFVLALFIKEVPLRGRAPSAEKPAPEAELVG